MKGERKRREWKESKERKKENKILHEGKGIKRNKMNDQIPSSSSLELPACIASSVLWPMFVFRSHSHNHRTGLCLYAPIAYVEAYLHRPCLHLSLPPSPSLEYPSHHLRLLHPCPPR